MSLLRVAPLREAVRELGALHPATLNALDNVGTVLLRQGEHVEALRVHERALAGRESALGADHADTLESANHVGCERNRNLPPRPRLSLPEGTRDAARSGCRLQVRARFGGALRGG